MLFIRVTQPSVKIKFPAKSDAWFDYSERGSTCVSIKHRETVESMDNEISDYIQLKIIES